MAPLRSISGWHVEASTGNWSQSGQIRARRAWILLDRRRHCLVVGFAAAQRSGRHVGRAPTHVPKAIRPSARAAGRDEPMKLRRSFRCRELERAKARVREKTTRIEGLERMAKEGSPHLGPNPNPRPLPGPTRLPLPACPDAPASC